jgi:hypothetical protein
MRKIAIELTAALKSGKSFNKGNTVYNHPVGSILFHGSLIATGINWGDNSHVRCSFSGYATPTTRDRINAVRSALGLPLVGFVKGVPHVDGRAIGLHEWF